MTADIQYPAKSTLEARSASHTARLDDTHGERPCEGQVVLKDPSSIGIVVPQHCLIQDPLRFQCGTTLNEYEIVYETYGTLNADRSNAVLVCHALSGNHHAAGYYSEDDKYPGWWNQHIGPGKAVDTNRLFVVACNNLGGCHGSTGPMTTNKETGKPFGADFPIVTVKDWVQSQAKLADHLGIDTWAAVIGGSLGGMQALQWSIDLPERLKHAVVIASAPKLSAQNIGFNEIARNAILADPEYKKGHYYEMNTSPRSGLGLARMLGHITYLSDEAMKAKFDRDMRNGRFSFAYDIDFQVESYLRYQGEAFSKRFDANTYLLMTRALDYFDPAADFDNDLSRALSQAKCRFLLMSFTTDWRFSPKRSQEIVDALVVAKKDVTYAEIDAPQGHDSFLMDVPQYQMLFKSYMSRIADRCDGGGGPASEGYVHAS